MRGLDCDKISQVCCLFSGNEYRQIYALPGSNQAFMYACIQNMHAMRACLPACVIDTYGQVHDNIRTCVRACINACMRHMHALSLSSSLLPYLL